MKPKAMKPKARFIRSVVSAAQECDTVMPWARRKTTQAPVAKLRTA